MGPYHAEEFCHHRGDAGEVMGPGSPFPSARKRRHCHGRLKALGVYGLGCRFKTDIHPFLAAHCPVAGNRAGIGRQIFSRAEL